MCYCSLIFLADSDDNGNINIIIGVAITTVIVVVMVAVIAITAIFCMAKKKGKVLLETQNSEALLRYVHTTYVDT